MRVITTFGTGYHEELLKISAPLMENYAKRHNCSFAIADIKNTLGRPVSWMKLPLLMQLLDRFEEVLWLDADVIICDGSVNLFDIVDNNALQAMTYHHTPDGEVPNCGVWLVRRGIEQMLDEAWAQTDLINAPWWEQSAVLRCMGYAESERPCKLKHPTKWYSVTQNLGTEWNSHPWDEHKTPYIRHATMYEDRAGVMREWAQEAK